MAVDMTKETVLVGDFVRIARDVPDGPPRGREGQVVQEQGDELMVQVPPGHLSEWFTISRADVVFDDYYPGHAHYKSLREGD